MISGVYCEDKHGAGPGSNSILEPLRITREGEAALKANIAGKYKTIKISLGLATQNAVRS